MLQHARRLLTVITVALVVAVCLTAPATADNLLCHFKFSRAAAAQQLDSLLVTLSQTSFDTTAYVLVDDIPSTVVAAIDSGSTGGVYTGTGVVTHAPRNLALVVEVTGAMQSMDSLYVGTQGSQGSTSYGNTGDQNIGDVNWRWYNLALTAAGGTVVNATGSQTFVFPVPCIPSAGTAWVWLKALRFIIQGDNTSAAKGFSTRAWLVWRDV